MNDILSNPAFLGVIGVIIGAMLSFVGNLLTQYLTAQKEERQWNRQQEALKIERLNSERKERENEELELFHKAISALSVVIAGEWDDPQDPDLAQARKEVLVWVSQLVVRFPDKELIETMEDFNRDSQRYFANLLNNYLLEMVKERASKVDRLTDGIPSTQKTPVRKIRFRIDEEFWKSLIISGIELPRDCEIEYDRAMLTPRHREHLLASHYQVHKCIPVIAELTLPRNSMRNQIPWPCKLNPEQVTLNEVLQAWASDFEQALKSVPPRIPSAPPPTAQKANSIPLSNTENSDVPPP